MKVALLLLLGTVLHAAEPVQLFPIEGPWKMHFGDDPRWAAPEFDDSAWSTCLPPAQGKGFAWYRRTIHIPNALALPASLRFPDLMQESEIYANGHLVLRYGAPGKWYSMRRGPVPAVEIDGRVVTLAVRIRSNTGYALPAWRTPQLGSRKGIALTYKEDQLARLRENTGFLFLAMLNLIFGMGAFFIWRGQRDQPIYFWFAVTQFTQVLWGIPYFFAYSTNLPHVWVLPGDLDWGIELAAYLFLFSGDKVWPGWRRFLLLPAMFLIYGIPMFLNYAGVLETTWADSFTLVLVLFVILSVWRVVKSDSSNRLLFLPWLVYELGWLSAVINSIWMVVSRNGLHSNTIQDFALEPFVIKVSMVGSVLGVVAMGGILLARFTRVARERQTFESELEAARQVQELLVPAASVQVSGFEVESAYLPAQQVGGDFFQILPAANGGLLLVVGDVSGKGLRAAMVVSMIVGALQNRRSDEPGSVLEELNRALAGRMGGGFATCCCARFDTDGTVTIANGGHPSPYCDEREIAVEAGLPLGLVPDVNYETTATQGHGFTFVSDGVVEAANAKAELFGFERTLAVSDKPAAEIAAAAKAWGQNDDITVVTVRRTG